MPRLRQRRIKRRDPLDITMLPCSTSIISQELQDVMTANLQETHTLGDKAARTLLEYQSRASRYLSWCLATHRVAVPASKETVEAYTIYCVDRLNTAASLASATGILVWLHGLAGDDDFELSKRTKRLRLGAQKTKQVRQAKQSKPITAALLDELATKINWLERTPALAVTAMMVQHDTGCRIEELSRLRLNDLMFRDDGSATIYLRSSKTDQTGKGASLYISATTMGAYVRFCKNHPADDAKALIPTRVGGYYSPGSLRLLITDFCKSQGLDEHTTHGCRVGLAVDMYHKGIDLVKATKYMRHKDTKMFLHYIRNETAVDVGAELASLMGR